MSSVRRLMAWTLSASQSVMNDTHSYDTYDTLRFLAGCRTRRLLNQICCVSYLSMFYIVLLFIWPLLCIVSFSLLCSVFWFFWLSCHYLPTDWVQRLAKPNRGEGIISIKPRPKRDLRFSWFIVLFHFLLCVSVVS